LPRDLGEKVAGNDLEAQPVFALLESKHDTPLVEAKYRPFSVGGGNGSKCPKGDLCWRTEGRSAQPGKPSFDRAARFLSHRDWAVPRAVGATLARYGGLRKFADCIAPRAGSALERPAGRRGVLSRR
jgi:hypothetical protein